MPSKLVYARPLIRRGLYDDLRSFAELENRIGLLGDENSKVVGDAFEVFVKGYLATHQKMQAESVWPVGQVPLEIRQKLNLPNDTKGIDGVFQTRTGTLVPYQVTLSAERIEKLDRIGFNWEGEDVLKTRHGRTQETFESLALSVLRGVGRPMTSGELIE